MIERLEPPLQALIIMSISMTLSLILRRQLSLCAPTPGILLGTAALDNEDIFVADRGLCVRLVLRGPVLELATYESPRSSPRC